MGPDRGLSGLHRQNGPALGEEVRIAGETFLAFGQGHGGNVFIGWMEKKGIAKIRTLTESLSHTRQCNG